MKKKLCFILTAALLIIPCRGGALSVRAEDNANPETEISEEETEAFDTDDTGTDFPESEEPGQETSETDSSESGGSEQKTPETDSSTAESSELEGSKQEGSATDSSAAETPETDITEPSETEQKDSLPEASETAPEAAQLDEESADLDGLVCLQIPEKLELVIDPWEMDGRGQIYSQSFILKNTGNTPGILTLSFTCSVNEEGGVAVSEIREELRGSEKKLIYIKAVLENGEEFVFTGDGVRCQINLQPGEELSLWFEGDVNENAMEPWKNGDIEIEGMYSWQEEE